MRSSDGGATRPSSSISPQVDGADAAAYEVVEGRLHQERRVGCDLKAWAAVHGFASLALDGPAELQDRAVPDAALAAMLAFVLDGLCGPRASPPATW